MRVARAIAAWTFPLSLFTYLNLSVVHPHDFWWHVKTGEIIARTRSIPQVELFSYARTGERWVNEPWLMQLALYVLYAGGGLALVVFAHALTVTAGYAFIWAGARRRDGASAAAVASLVGALVGILNWGVRPQSASFLFFGATVAAIENDRAGRHRALWILPPLFIVWVNCHGGFTFGLLALVTYAACRVVQDRTNLRTLGPVVLAAFIACCLTPLGPRGIVEHVGAFFESGVGGPTNLEFEALSIRSVDGVFFFYAAGRLIYPLLKGRPLPKLDEAVPLLVFAACALAMGRFVPWFGMMLIPVLSRTLAAEREPGTPAEEPSPRAPILGGILAIVSLVTLPCWRTLLPLPPSMRTFVSDDTPTAATKWVCENVPEGERLFSVQAHTSFVEWKCPRVGVLIDTRIQAFPKATWNDYFAVENARYDWEEVLAKYQIRYVMLSLDQTTTIKALAASPRWKELHRDDTAVIWGPSS